MAPFAVFLKSPTSEMGLVFIHRRQAAHVFAERHQRLPGDPRSRAQGPGRQQDSSNTPAGRCCDIDDRAVVDDRFRHILDEERGPDEVQFAP